MNSIKMKSIKTTIVVYLFAAMIASPAFAARRVRASYQDHAALAKKALRAELLRLPMPSGAKFVVDHHGYRFVATEIKTKNGISKGFTYGYATPKGERTKYTLSAVGVTNPGEASMVIGLPGNKAAKKIVVSPHSSPNRPIELSFKSVENNQIGPMTQMPELALFTRMSRSRETKSNDKGKVTSKVEIHTSSPALKHPLRMSAAKIITKRIDMLNLVYLALKHWQNPY